MMHDYSALFKAAFLLVFPKSKSGSKSNSMITGRKKSLQKRNRDQYYFRFYRLDRTQALGRWQRKTDFDFDSDFDLSATGTLAISSNLA
jgi:hypothetical protein